MRFRMVARLAATGLLVGGALAVAGAPAQAAADVDFAIGLKGTTFPQYDWSKPATVSVTNLGTTKPDQATIRFDSRGLLGGREGGAEFLWRFGELVDTGQYCSFVREVKDCRLTEAQIPGPGETVDLDLHMISGNNEPPGPQGKLIATVMAEGDAVASNDSTSVDVVLRAADGPDLRAIAHDVTRLNGQGRPNREPMQPGESSAFWGVLTNEGTFPAKNIAFTIGLPEHVTFTARYPGCSYNGDLTKAACEFGDDFVMEGSEYPGSGGVEIKFPVKLAADAEGPARLTGGTLSVTGNLAPRDRARKAKPSTALPSYAKTLAALPPEVDEVDASDNSDAFAALVAGPAGGGGGGTGGDDPELPVTGPVAASAAGFGAALLVSGAMLIVTMRRRRRFVA